MPPCPEDLPVLPAHDPLLAAQIAWAIIIVGVLVFEYWAWRTHHRTLSQAVQRRAPWVRWAAIGGLIALGLHLWGVF